MKVHPETGDRSIFVARHAFSACVSDDPSVTLPREESRELLSSLVTHALADDGAVYKHEWEVGDTLLWDNRRLLHRAYPYVYTEPRVLLGTRIEGDEDCLADNSTPGDATAGEESAAPSAEAPFGLCGRAVLAEELVAQRAEVAAGAPRMLSATLPDAIVAGSTVAFTGPSAAQRKTVQGSAFADAAGDMPDIVPALSPSQLAAIHVEAAAEKSKL